MNLIDDKDLEELKDIYPYNLIHRIASFGGLDFTKVSLFSLNEAICDMNLDDRNMEILRLRYKEKLSYKKISDKLFISRERVRQLESKMLRRLTGRFHILTTVTQEKYNKLEQQKEKLQIDNYALRVENAKLNNTTLTGDDSEIAVLHAVKITSLDLSVRSYNCLTRAGIETLGQIVQKDICDIAKIRNLGYRSAVEIFKLLKDHNLKLTKCNREKAYNLNPNIEAAYHEMFDDSPFMNEK